MRISISNIAWDVRDDGAVAALLRRHAVDAIDIAPGKYFPDPTLATDAEIKRVRSWWEDQGVAIVGMQALLFGTSGLNVFGDSDSRDRMLVRLDAVCRIAGKLGATRLVFGSPKNRDRTGLSDAEVGSVAETFFRQLGQRASAHGVIVCLEPNPTRYGANFMTDSEQTAAVVRAVHHPAIRMQLDVGSLTINGEDAGHVVTAHQDLIAHVHASEPDLVPLGDGNSDHSTAAAAIRAFLPELIVTIEMLALADKSGLEDIDRALALAVAHYGDLPR